MRTVLNTAEKLVDYSCSPYLVYGVYHNTVFERMAKLLVKLDYRKALIVQGAEGSEDIFIERPTRTYFVEDGEARLHVIDPETYGLDTPLPETEEAWTAAKQIEVTEAVLQGGGHLAYMNQVLLNAAVRLRLSERVDSVEEGLYTCKHLLENGSAWELYRKWKGAMLAEGADKPNEAVTQL